MRRITEFLLWLYVFTVPWDFVTIPGVGGLTRLQGMVVVGATLLTIIAEGRFRRPDAIMWLAGLFTVVNVASLVWTISFGTTWTTGLTYVQLLASAWIVREIARTPRQQMRLMVAFCLGIFVPMASLLINYGQRSPFSGAMQYSSIGLNADGMGLLLVIGIPLAWHLFLTQGRLSRTLSLAYLAIAPLGVLLTAVRGAFIAGLVAASVVPLSQRFTFRRFVQAAALVAVIAVMVVTLVPNATWQRIATIPEEIVSGSMSARRDLWTAGVQVFPERPVLGFGAGTFGLAIASRQITRLKPDVPAHSVPIGLLVETGVVGFVAFVAFLTGCVMAVRALPSPERTIWIVLLLVWLVGALSLSVERWKVTWLLVGLLAARHGIAAAPVRAPQPGRTLVPSRAPQPAYVPRTSAKAAR